MHNGTPAGHSPSLPADLLFATTRVPVFHQLPEPDLSCNWVMPSSQREGPHSLTWHVRPHSPAIHDFCPVPPAPQPCTSFHSLGSVQTLLLSEMRSPLLLWPFTPLLLTQVLPLIRATGTGCPRGQVPARHSTPALPPLPCLPFLVGTTPGRRKWMSCHNSYALRRDFLSFVQRPRRQPCSCTMVSVLPRL